MKQRRNAWPDADYQLQTYAPLVVVQTPTAATVYVFAMVDTLEILILVANAYLIVAVMSNVSQMHTVKMDSASVMQDIQVTDLSAATIVAVVRTLTAEPTRSARMVHVSANPVSKGIQRGIASLLKLRIAVNVHVVQMLIASVVVVNASKATLATLTVSVIAQNPKCVGPWFATKRQNATMDSVSVPMDTLATESQPACPEKMTFVDVWYALLTPFVMLVCVSAYLASPATDLASAWKLQLIQTYAVEGTVERTQSAKMTSVYVCLVMSVMLMMPAYQKSPFQMLVRVFSADLTPTVRTVCASASRDSPVIQSSLANPFTTLPALASVAESTPTVAAEDVSVQTITLGTLIPTATAPHCLSQMTFAEAWCVMRTQLVLLECVDAIMAMKATASLTAGEKIQ